MRSYGYTYRTPSGTGRYNEFMEELILLDIHDFDVILGMDWLSRHHATVDCYRKEVRFCRLGET